MKHSITWLGPGFELEEVVLVPDGGKAIVLGDVVVRPAWSTSWFRAVPAASIGVSSDPMQADDCPEGVLQPILDRIHLESLGSPSFYRRESLRLGLSEVAFEDLTHQLTAHYGRVLQETERRESELSHRISGEYLARMRKGLGHWVEGGHQGHLAWGIFHFRKD